MDRFPLQQESSLRLTRNNLHRLDVVVVVVVVVVVINLLQSAKWASIKLPRSFSRLSCHQADKRTHEKPFYSAWVHLSLVSFGQSGSSLFVLNTFDLNCVGGFQKITNGTICGA